MSFVSRYANLTPTPPPRILFIDAFDSFTNNIIGLLEQCLHAEVTLVRMNDAKFDQNLKEFLSNFDGVLIGPGPGHPGVASDVGFISKLWALPDFHMLPILGVCLGFQSLCLAYGAEVKKLRSPRHGIVTKPSHNDTDIFEGIGSDLETTQYHSLHVDLLRSENGLDKVFWEPCEACPSLRPLAWDTTEEVNGPILMAVRHVSKPFWGVQFHPESICTSKEGNQLISNWWASAQKWLEQSGRKRAIRMENVGAHIFAPQLVLPTPEVTPDSSPVNCLPASHLATQLRSIIGGEDIFLRWEKHSAASITPTSLLEALGHSQNEAVLLDSQGHASGRFSIIGLMVPGKTMKVTYKVPDKSLRYGIDQGPNFTIQLNSIDEVWPMLQEALDLHDPRNQEGSSPALSTGSDFLLTRFNQHVAGHLPVDSPFWGGFMGYISYEAGLETIDVEPHASCATFRETPDINFAFMHRTIVIDHKTAQAYIQSLLPNDWAWILDAGRIIDRLAGQVKLPLGNKASQASIVGAKEGAALDKWLNNAHVARPEEMNYRNKVLRCQASLESGDSYELCLTDETEITLPTADRRVGGLDSWALYKRLRTNNAAPFGAFMRLSGVTVIGSSPERFLQWTREGACQFRPIKGTVKKSSEMTRERAHQILGSSKERAENLMIVDLIRHDLSGVVGADKTWVSKLMVVEEYETVYQLVSVIEGQLSDTDGNLGQARRRGIDVLKASLPPGSMTGAPKKRSCEILTDIERRPRGVYSGVLGYMDVGGAGDFSVVIRTAVRSKRGKSRKCKYAGIDKNGEVWRVGAGGAVTIQSTDEGEFQEMEVKASSVLSSLFPR